MYQIFNNFVLYYISNFNISSLEFGIPETDCARRKAASIAWGKHCIRLPHLYSKNSNNNFLHNFMSYSVFSKFFIFIIYYFQFTLIF